MNKCMNCGVDTPNTYYCSDECSSEDCMNPIWDEMVEQAQQQQRDMYTPESIEARMNK